MKSLINASWWRVAGGAAASPRRRRPRAPRSSGQSGVGVRWRRCTCPRWGPSWREVAARWTWPGPRGNQRPLWLHTLRGGPSSGGRRVIAAGTTPGRVRGQWPAAPGGRRGGRPRTGRRSGGGRVARRWGRATCARATRPRRRSGRPSGAWRRSRSSGDVARPAARQRPGGRAAPEAGRGAHGRAGGPRGAAGAARPGPARTRRPARAGHRGRRRGLRLAAGCAARSVRCAPRPRWSRGCGGRRPRRGGGPVGAGPARQPAVHPARPRPGHGAAGRRAHPRRGIRRRRPLPRAVGVPGDRPRALLRRHPSTSSSAPGRPPPSRSRCTSTRRRASAGRAGRGPPGPRRGRRAGAGRDAGRSPPAAPGPAGPGPARAGPTGRRRRPAAALAGHARPPSSTRSRPRGSGPSSGCCGTTARTSAPGGTAATTRRRWRCWATCCAGRGCAARRGPGPAGGARRAAVRHPGRAPGRGAGDGRRRRPASPATSRAGRPCPRPRGCCRRDMRHGLRRAQRPALPRRRPAGVPRRAPRPAGAPDARAVASLRRYGPVGCRDRATVDLLLGHGIDAFFSGPVTTTRRRASRRAAPASPRRRVRRAGGAACVAPPGDAFRALRAAGRHHGVTSLVDHLAGIALRPGWTSSSRRRPRATRAWTGSSG